MKESLLNDILAKSEKVPKRQPIGQQMSNMQMQHELRMKQLHSEERRLQGESSIGENV